VNSSEHDGAWITVTRIFTGADGASHFEDLRVPLRETERGLLSDPVPSGGDLLLRGTPPGGDLDFHVAPRRQFVLHLRGMVEIECGDGTKRRFGPGDVLLADDTTGQGHISRDVQTPRRQLFVPVPGDFDLSSWEVMP
jgi:hypothetical protein